MTADTTEVAKELRERALEMHAAAWSRPDGGQECTIGASLCDAAADEIERLTAENERLKATYTPGHTDMMVSPESLDAWLEGNPLPASSAEVDLECLDDPYAALSQHLHGDGDAAWRTRALAAEAEVERLADDCILASKALHDTGTFETGQAILGEAAATLRALRAENARLKRLEHGLRNEAKDYHDEMHKGFDEIARLRAERDAAWQAGAEAMREAAMRAVNRTVIPIAGTPYSAGGCQFAAAIRALPLPSQPKEGAA